MENSNRINEDQQDLQIAVVNEEQWQFAPLTEEESELSQMDNNGFNADTDEVFYASDRDDDDDDDREDDDRDDDEEEADTDWGEVDPLENGVPDSNDPSGPGSAV